MDKVKEHWKQLVEYPDYVVSDRGRIRSLQTGVILKTFQRNTGYLTVSLRNDEQSKTCYVHRLVATMFIPNDNTLEHDQVNHIDGNKKNNSVSNLEWVSSRENKQHAIKTGLIKKYGRQKSVAKMDMDGNILEVFPSARAAAASSGLSQGNISNVCRGYGNSRRDGSQCHHFTAGGFRWMYVNTR